MKRTPLKRKTPMRRKRKPTAYLVRGLPIMPGHFAPADTLENARRREWVHRQPCVFGRVTGDPCSGPLDEMHCDRGKGVGIKSPLPTFPGCRRHHELVSGAVRHTMVIPMNTLWRRAFEALASKDTERDWVEVQAHDTRRKGLL